MKYPTEFEVECPIPASRAFIIEKDGIALKVITSDYEGWEHVSVSLNERTPTWAEMDFVKDLFWDEEQCVMQLHVPKIEHVNLHNNCLHLWRPINQKIPRPE